MAWHRHIMIFGPDFRMNIIPGLEGFRRIARSAVFATFVAAIAAAAMPCLMVEDAAATSIAILVNDDPITKYDIAQREKLIGATSRGAGNIKQRAIDELIDEKLKVQAARRLGVTVASAEVDQAFAAIATRVKLSPAQFSQALQQLGVNPASLKKRLESDLMWQNVVRARFRTSVNIRDRDIETALARKGEEMPTTSVELDIQQIILIIPQGSSAAYIRQRKADANAFRAQYTGCDSARDLAKSFRDIVVKDRVRRNSADLPPNLAEDILEIPVDGISSANETPSAIDLIAICGREEVTDTEAARKQVRSELMNEQGDRLSRRLLIDLKQSAVIEYR
jgi:peptidyl-prolyl cis-trans isomerase SurA